MKVFNYQEIDFNNILIGKKKFNNTYNYMDIRYNNKINKTPLLIKTPILKVNEINTNIIRGRYIESNIIDNDFLKFLNNLDNYFINKIVDKSTSIFNEKKDLSYIKEIFKRSIIFDNNKFISRFNLIENNNDKNTLLFNEKKESIKLEDLEKSNCAVKMILNINSLKYINDEIVILYLIEIVQINERHIIQKYINTCETLFENSECNNEEIAEFKKINNQNLNKIMNEVELSDKKKK